MTLDDFLGQLEAEWTGRSEELRRLATLVDASAEEDRDALRRPLVLLLYAHLEGHCVFALRHYLAAINAERLRCRELAPAVLAGAWDRLFQAMESGDQKNQVFARGLPDDGKLHRHWRRRHFVEEMDRFLDAREDLPDDLVDAESNLKPLVLKRNLFLLGLDHTLVDNDTANALNQLLDRRNRIAHGSEMRGVSGQDLKRCDDLVKYLVGRLAGVLTDAFREGRFMRSVSPAI